MTGQQFTLCLQDGVCFVGRLTVGMGMVVGSSVRLQMANMGAGVSWSQP